MRKSVWFYQINRCAVVILFFSLLLLWVRSTVAQSSYPQSLRVPVTFYDFHSDSSNPEFEICPPGSNLMRGMVANTLDNERKPLIGSSPFFNRRIDRWFRPWSSGDFQIYNYYGEMQDNGDFRASRFDRYSSYPTGLTTIDHDTSFKNIVIQDTLEFQYVPGSAGMYEYNNGNFFPLDGKGFGYETREHNYSFTMELHWTFTMVPGLTFNFTGDDDVWAFVNDSLVLEIGGIHNPESGSITVDNIPGLLPNQQYRFDLFYAERHVTGSNIRISTNIIAPPSRLRIYDNPDAPGSANPPITTLEAVTAGEPVTVYGHVFDSSDIWQQEFDRLITWRVEGNGAVQLSSTEGSSTTLTPDASLAGQEFVLVASFTNPDNPSQPTAETRIIVRVASEKEDPPEPVEHHLDIVLDSLAGRAEETGFSTFSFSEEVHIQQLYVVVRDPEGNFIRYAEEALWASSDEKVVTLSPERGLRTVITKGADGLGHKALVIVQESGVLPDTLTVLWRGEVRKTVVPNPFTPRKVDISTVLPQSVITNYTPVIKASGTPYITLVGIQTAEELKVYRSGVAGASSPESAESFGQVLLYDVVGNLVRNDLPLVAARNKLTYGIGWDGTNRHGRIVGTGAYLMIIKTISVQGLVSVFKVKIGVRIR